MAWGSFLLVGDMGQRLDLSEQVEEIGRLRRSLARRQSKDLDQDAVIAVLGRENLNLKLSLAAVVRLLVTRGVVGPEEIAGLVRALDHGEPAAADASTNDVPAPRPDAPAAATFKTSRKSGKPVTPSVNSRQQCVLARST